MAAPAVQGIPACRFATGGGRNYPDYTVIVPDDQGKPGKQREKAQETGQRCPECE